jgi:hypothetical protein
MSAQRAGKSSIEPATFDDRSGDEWARRRRSCRHRFSENPVVLFVDTEGARLCEDCFSIDVLVQSHWIALDDYLERRRTART